MDASALSLFGNAQDSLLAGLQKKTAAKLAGVASPTGSKDPAAENKKVREAAQEFEAFFIGQMMENMMAGLETDPMFGGGAGEDMWRSLLNQEYGKEIAKSGRLGIADHVMRGMLAAQEERDQAALGATQTPAESAATADATAASATIVPPASAFMPIRR